MISVSTDRTRARCREDVRSRIWRFVEDRRRFPSAILITEANYLTVVKRREISCVLVMLIRHLVLSFLKSLSHFMSDLGACPRSLSEGSIVLYDH